MATLPLLFDHLPADLAEVYDPERPWILLGGPLDEVLAALPSSRLAAPVPPEVHLSGDGIVIDAAVEAYTDQQAGLEPGESLFTRRKRVDRDIAVVFLVDMSGSTKGWINEIERESLVLLCEALEILGDRYAIYGFSGLTHRRCDLFRVKDLHEPYGEEVRSRISGIKPQDYTRMGVFIRHITTSNIH